MGSLLLRTISCYSCHLLLLWRVSSASSALKMHVLRLKIFFTDQKKIFGFGFRLIMKNQANGGGSALADNTVLD